MSNSPDHAARLRTTAATLFALVGAEQKLVEARVAELDREICKAKAREHRRAEFNQRDKNCYRLGGAFEPTGGLELAPVTMTGFLTLGSTALLLLAQHAIVQPDLSMVDLLGRLFRSPAGQVIRSNGVWVRWNWLCSLYIAETEKFFCQ